MTTKRETPNPRDRGFINAPIQEMIEEYLKMDREANDILTADDIAADLVDNLCAQGYLNANDEVEVNQAIHLITNQIKYMTGEQ